MASVARGKMFSITNYYGSENQNYNKISLHACYNDCCPKDKNKCQRCGEKRIVIHCCWLYSLVQPLWTIVLQFLKKLKIEIPYEPDIPLLGISLKNTKTLIQKNIGTRVSMFIPSLFTIAKIWKPPECPSTYEIKKLCYMYRYIYTQWHTIQP